MFNDVLRRFAIGIEASIDQFIINMFEPKARAFWHRHDYSFNNKLDNAFYLLNIIFTPSGTRMIVSKV